MTAKAPNAKKSSKAKKAKATNAAETVKPSKAKKSSKPNKPSKSTSTLASTADILPNQLAEGYLAFRKGRLKKEGARFRQLADKGQKPPTLLICCCDSRVAPEVIFDAAPGEIFVMRNIAALIPPFELNEGREETAAAVEYAVLALNVAHVVVMGHAQCGGVRAFAAGALKQFEPLSKENFVGHWKVLIQPAADRIGPPTADFDAYCERLCEASIIQGLANLRTYPWLKAREEAGDLSLHGAYFGIAKGELSALDQKTGGFVPVAPATV